MNRDKRQCGLTLIEMTVAVTIMMLLTTSALPLARSTIRRERERDLHYALREIRTAIDKYKDLADAGVLGPVKVGTEGYPESLEVLVEGARLTGSLDRKLRFLRRIPRDPFTNSTDWGTRSMQDDPNARAWGGQNVFDVYSKTTDKGRDGTSYSEW